MRAGRRLRLRRLLYLLRLRLLPHLRVWVLGRLRELLLRLDRLLLQGGYGVGGKVGPQCL
jgi:hypothetical protein